MTEILGADAMGSASATRTPGQLESALEAHRRELTGYCYRMLGSAFEADDAVQETLLRAWRGIGGFKGDASLRSWLYRIATNVCLDMLDGRRRRARPMDLERASVRPSGPGEPLPSDTWVEPIPDSSVVGQGADPADLTVERETIRLAFVAALQHLPPRQRAVLILREVLRWKADEVAGLLDTSIASVNSALQRARATMAARHATDGDLFAPMDEQQQALLRRFVDAFERYDLDLLTSLLHEDAVQSMPPYSLWLRGPDEVRAWWLGPGIGCRGSRLLATAANGTPAFGQYKPGDTPGTLEPWALHALDVVDDRIAAINTFLDTERLFPLFGLPPGLKV
ncbi:MAG: sigma-70 family RNA polymerase sigma factor [Nitriliruptorales bacterium]|nr:sigma-70 family RNA polymerase sigma factor [Nitriliruptorales bacterium]